MHKKSKPKKEAVNFDEKKFFRDTSQSANNQISFYICKNAESLMYGNNKRRVRVSRSTSVSGCKAREEVWSEVR